jgi:putative colanic acid biosynthesis UDP-glucose lipid carrier transferase
MDASLRSLPIGTTSRSLTQATGALLDPALIVATLALSTWVHGGAFDAPEMLLAILVFALTFPSPVRGLGTPAALAREVFSTWATVSFMLLFFGYAGRFLGHFDARALVVWALATPATMVVGHLAYERVVRRIAAEHGRRAVIVGVNPVARSLRARMASASHLGLRFAGYFDDRAPARLGADAPPVLSGRLAELPAFVQQRGIDVIYITLPMSSQPRVMELLNGLGDTTASIYFAPDMTMFDLIQARVAEVDGLPVLAVCESPFHGVQGALKRLIDVTVAGVGLLVLAPLLLVVAAAIRIESPGPVIFRQRRYGLDGREIVVWKFRSMRVTEDGATTYRQVEREDPRVTRVGRVIRATSIDELPQLVNVLQGRMSLVGPRPHAVAVNERYRKLISGYMVRHKVRPGITGWAQVNGHRGGDDIESMRRRIEHDLDYLRNWSLQLDFTILARTALTVLRDAKAY